MQSNKTIILTAAFLILTILTAGCISSDSVQTYQQADVPKEVIDTQPVQVVPVEVVPEPVVEVAPVEVEAHWWDGREGFYQTTIDADDNLFGVEVEGVKYDNGITVSYELFDDNQKQIFIHEEYTASTLHLERELPIEQYRALIAEYGLSLIHI